MRTKTLLPVLTLLVIVPVIITGCSRESPSPTGTAITLDAEMSLATLKENLDRIPIGDPGEEEIAHLLHMREEEKVARDAYITLDGLYGEAYDLDIFANISLSEQKHMDTVLILLERYELEDPVGDNAVGEFTDPDLQELYDDLMESGAQSLTDALLVGLAIEEIDILDLHHAMDISVMPDILMVLGNICDGSENHLRAFVRVYESWTGETYTPRWLDPAEYAAIIAVDPDQGDGGNGNQGGNRP